MQRENKTHRYNLRLIDSEEQGKIGRTVRDLDYHWGTLTEMEGK